MRLIPGLDREAFTIRKAARTQSGAAFFVTSRLRWSTILRVALRLH